ncbi:MAG TPA: peptidylprolyl isomerase [Verrucomicrobiae bacterium]|nr:peptidylprolyl isomerase [Verrucomicrobiae bacterium]
MNTKIKPIFCATLAASLMILPHVHAATSGSDMANLTAGAGADSNTNPANVMAQLFGDPVIVKGKGFEIKQSQLDAVMDAIKSKAAAAGQTIPSQGLSALTQTALNSLIANQILLQQATDADKAAGKKDADDYIQQAIKRFGTKEAVETQLKAAGKTFDSWSNDITQQATATAVMVRELNAAPTAAEIQKFYNDNTNASELPEQAHVRHILLFTIDPATQQPLSDDQIKAKKKQIDEILKRARAGEDFATLAKEYSEDPSTKADGGELPPFSHGQMVPEFDTAAFALTNNEISDVVTTKYGYHIIKMIDKTPARKLKLTDTLPNTDMTLEDYLKERLTAQKLQEEAPAFIEKLSKSPGVEILDPSLKAMMAAETNAPAN